MNTRARHATRYAASNLTRSLVWVLGILIFMLAFGLAARALDVTLPQVYQAKPVYDTEAVLPPAKAWDLH